MYCPDGLLVRVAILPHKGIGLVAAQPLRPGVPIAYYVVKSYDQEKHTNSIYALKLLDLGEGRMGDLFSGSLQLPEVSGRYTIPFVGFLLNEPTYPRETEENCELVNIGPALGGGLKADGTLRQAIRTIRAVPSGAELTLDYGPYYRGREYASKYDTVQIQLK